MTASVLITGGFGALGTAVAKHLVSAGHRVACMDLRGERGDQGPGSLDIGGIDLTDVQAVSGALRSVLDVHGGLDVLVNLAGGFAWQTIEQGKEQLWSDMFRCNVLSTVTITAASLDELKKSRAGRIVNVGAGAALKAAAGMGAYAASKSGVHRFTEALAEELAGTQVTVNAILPTIIDTPANRADMPEADFSTWVSPQAIAEVIDFFISDASRSITGALLHVNRGT